MKNDSNSSSQAGFTLVETIAAMGVLALAAIPLLQLVNNSIRSSGSLEHRFLARTVAENILVQQLSKQALPSDSIDIETGTSEQLGRQFQWVLTASPVKDAQPQLIAVEVRLADAPQLLAKLSGVRLPQLPSSDLLERETSPSISNSNPGEER